MINLLLHLQQKVGEGLRLQMDGVLEPGAFEHVLPITVAVCQSRAMSESAEAVAAPGKSSVRRPESRLYNEDLAPVLQARRKWRMGSFAALWISMSACIPTYML